MIKGTPNGGINRTLSNGLIGHWGFIDGSLNDESGNGRNWRQVGNPIYGQDLDGNINNCIVLNNYNYLYLPNPYLNLYSFSGSFIFKVESPNTHIFALADYPSDNSSGGTFHVGSNGNLHFYSGGNIDTGVFIQDGKFHHVVFKAQGDGTFLYIDGNNLGKLSPIMKNSKGYIYLGKLDIVGGNVFLDEIRMYNRLLTESEISEIFTMKANYQSDTEPPIFNTINISNITYNSFRMNVNCNENAIIYYKVSNRNDSSPSSIELKQYNNGSFSIPENTLSNIVLGGLLESTEYSLYVVAEDSIGNLQTLPSKIDFSTIANDKNIRLSLGMFSDVLSPAYYNGFFQSLDKNGFTNLNYNTIFLNPNVLPKIYEYGIEKNGETLTYNLQIPILPQEEKIIWIENYISPTSDNFNFSGAIADLDKYYGKYNSIQYAKEFKDINNLNDNPYPFLLITDKIYNDNDGNIIYKDFDNSNIEFSFLPSDKEGYKSKIVIKNTLSDNFTKSEISVSEVIASTLKISIDAFSKINIGNVIKLKEIKNMSDPFYNIYKSNYDVKYKIINKYIEGNSFYITLDKVYPFYKYNSSYISCELFNENIILLNYLSIRGNPIIFKTGKYEIKDTGSIDRYGDKLYKIQSSLFPLSYYEKLGKTIVSERKSANKIDDIQYEYKKEYTKFIAEFNLEHYLLNIGDLIYITEDYYYNIINEPFQIISIKRSANGSERGSKIVALSCRLLKDNTYNNVFKEVEASNIKSISSLDPTDYLTDKNILATRYVTQFGEAYNSIGKTAAVVSKMDKIVKFNISDFTNIDTSNIVFAINDIYYQTTLVEQDSQYLSFLLINDKVENIDSIKVNDIAYIYQNELTVNKSYTVSEYQSSRTSNKLYFSYSLKDIYDSIIVRIYESDTYESATMFENVTEPTLILQTQTREDKFLIGSSENCNLKYDIKYDKYYTIHLTIVSLQEDLYPQEKITVYTPTNSYTIDYKGGS